MLVLGALGPGGHEIGKLEVSRRQVPRPDAIALVFVEQAPLATAQILPDVVEVDADGRGVALARPVFGGGVELDVDLGGVDGLTLDEDA